MANRVRSTALIGGVAVFAVLLLMVQHGQAQTVASDLPAGYVIFPKIVVDSSDAGFVGHKTDTLIQLTNTGPNCQQVECFYVDATKHCSGGGTSLLNDQGACRTNADCAPGVTCGMSVPAGGKPADCGRENNFFLFLSSNQPVGWSADRGGVVPPDGICSDGPQTIPAAGESFFQGEVKCIEVTSDQINPPPIAANDLKGEATIYEVAGGTPGGVDVRAYNAIGVQAVKSTGDPFLVCSDGAGKACTGNSDCTTPATCVPSSTLCLGTNGGTCVGGACVGGTRSTGACTTNADCGACTSATHASCPSTMVLNHFFDRESTDPSISGTTTDLTLVPCSENLAAPPGPSGIKPTVAQFTVYNEFEQRFSASISVGCFKETQLSNIDTLPGNETVSIFNINVQGTLVGQTRIRGVTGSDADVGHGLLGVAEEFVNFGNGDFPRGSDAFNLNYIGTNANKADVVFVPSP